MAQYPIDFLKRNDGQRFFPVTHPSAIFDGEKNLYQILNERLLGKMDKLTVQNGVAIAYSPFSSTFSAGAGVLALKIPITKNSIESLIEISGTNNGKEFILHLAISRSGGVWEDGSVFCSNTTAINGKVSLGEISEKYYIILGDNTTNWGTGQLKITTFAINREDENILSGYSLELVSQIESFSNILNLPINSSFSVSNADSVGGWRVDDTKNGTNDTTDNSIWTAYNIVKHLNEKADNLDVYTTGEVDGFLNDKADKTTVYVKGEVDGLLDERAPTNHRSAGEQYGIGTSSLYGHVKIVDSINSSIGADSGYAAAPNAVKVAYDYAKTKADINHSDTTNKYGVGNATLYGHLMLSDAINLETAEVTGGVAATPYAVKTVYDLANTKSDINHASTATTYGIGNGTNYGHVQLIDSGALNATSGVAASPSYVNTKVTKAGDTMTGVLKNSISSSWLDGFKGTHSFLSSTANRDAMTMIAQKFTKGGAMGFWIHQTDIGVGFISQATINAESNIITKSATLLNESGNTLFPGNVSATTFNGWGVSTGAGSWAGIVGKIPVIQTNGIMEVAKHIDFHDTNSTIDYNVRLSAVGSSVVISPSHFAAVTYNQAIRNISMSTAGPSGGFYGDVWMQYS